MLRNLFTLFRGAAHVASEDFSDRHALLLLQQQMREAAATLEAARRAVAVALAQNHQEVTQHETLLARIADLETRTMAALQQEQRELATEAAEAIAMLEAERDVSAQAQAHFSTEISRLKKNVHVAEMKLRELQRGQRLAVARDKAQRLRATMPQNNLASLSDAEATLTRLQERQSQMDLTADALDALKDENNPARLVEKLADAGCGAALKSSAEDVLARLRSQMDAPV